MLQSSLNCKSDLPTQVSKQFFSLKFYDDNHLNPDIFLIINFEHPFYSAITLAILFMYICMCKYIQNMYKIFIGILGLFFTYFLTNTCINCIQKSFHILVRKSVASAWNLINKQANFFSDSILGRLAIAKQQHDGIARNITVIIEGEIEKYKCYAKQNY